MFKYRCEGLTLNRWKAEVAGAYITRMQRQSHPHTIIQIDNDTEFPLYYFSVSMPFFMSNRSNIATMYMQENDEGNFTFVYTTKGNEALVNSLKEQEGQKKMICCSTPKAKKKPSVNQVGASSLRKTDIQFGSDVQMEIIDYIEAKPF